MKAAATAVQRRADARLLVVDAAGRIEDAPRACWLEYLRRGDVVVANDAATLPASLHGVHARSGAPIEARLAAWHGTEDARGIAFDAIVFGAGDWRTPTERRAPPPPIAPGDTLQLGPLAATVEACLGHPRLVRLVFAVPRAAFWRGLAAHGRPVQYAHLREPLALWDAWTPIAAKPLAFEPPSAGFALDWQTLATLRARGIAFATLTHAAGLSSSGDPLLDARLPLDEAYRIPARTARMISALRPPHPPSRSPGLPLSAPRREGWGAGQARVIAIGTTVVRALEHAARDDGGVNSGDGVATQRIGAQSRLRVVDGLLTGTHEPGSSHHELLRAFADDDVLARATGALERLRFRTHEFGDSMLVMSRYARGTNPPVRRSGSVSDAVSRAASACAARGSAALCETATE
jgi:S-adenosylmethionine:tRNA ribosyltransferase-isomerase